LSTAVRPAGFLRCELGPMRTNWVPAVTDGLAEDREVILFNNAGVSSRSDEVPTVGHLSVLPLTARRVVGQKRSPTSSSLLAQSALACSGSRA